MDLNAFFASVEQLDFPELRGRPVAVTNGAQGTCIITCSYEARSYGIKTGMRLYEARRICPGLIQCPSRPQRYAALSSLIMTALEALTPCKEIFSIDEVFLDVTQTQPLFGEPAQIAQRVKELVYETSGLLCSVGVSSDKTSAKFAAKQNKPDGLTVIEPEQVAQRLARVPVTELCGIAKGIGGFLEKHGVVFCGDMQRLPIQVLSKRYGPPGRRIWHMAQGQDTDPVAQKEGLPQTIGHGKVLPPNTCDKQTIETYLQHMSEKVAQRMRQYGFKAQKYSISLRTPKGQVGNKFKLEAANNDGLAIYQLAKCLMENAWQGAIVSHVQVTALDPVIKSVQPDLFCAINEDKACLNAMMDEVNDKFGHYSLMPAKLVKRSSMPDVIAPAWRPEDVRKSV